jgi:hypothetical protein
VKRIKSAKIILPTRFGDKAKVVAKLDDGQEGEIFSYYHDELTFVPEEFIGLTVEEAHELFFRKDVEYLRS